MLVNLQRGVTSTSALLHRLYTNAVVAMLYWWELKHLYVLLFGN